MVIAPRKAAACLLSVIYLTVNVLLPHAAEANVWDDRRDAAQRMKGDSRAASADSFSGQRALLAQLPTAVHVAIGASQAASVGAGLTVTQGASGTLDLPAPSAASPSWISTLLLPYGTLREMHLAKTPGAPVVIHIQDAHGVEEAQKNMAAMIQGLKENRGVDLVGVEGAEGAFNLDPYRDWPDAAVTRDIAETFLKEGRIGGPEFVGITAPQAPALWGVEDSPLYLANVRALREARAGKPALEKSLADLKAATASLKETLYSPDLKEFDAHFAAYQNQTEGLGAYARYLLVTHQRNPPLLLGEGAPKGRVRGSDFPNLLLLLRALASEDALDFKRVEEERRELVEWMAARLPRAKLDLLIDRSFQYRAGRLGYGDYHRFLQSLCRDNGIPLDTLPQLKAYIAYVLLAESIDRNALLDELTSAEKAAQDRLAVTPEQKRLVAIGRRLALLEKLAAQAMTPGDWAAYQDQRQGVLGLPADIAGLSAVPSPLGRGGGEGRSFESLLKPFEDFCGNAVHRNDAFIRTLTEQMRQRRSSAAVLVAGGFHSDGLARLMRAKDLSYVVVTPKITEVPKDNNYLDVFARDPLPLEKLFSGDKIFLRYAATIGPKKPMGEFAAASSADRLSWLLALFARMRDVNLLLRNAAQAGLQLADVRIKGDFLQLLLNGRPARFALSGKTPELAPPSLAQRLASFRRGPRYGGTTVGLMAGGVSLLASAGVIIAMIAGAVAVTPAALIPTAGLGLLGVSILFWGRLENLSRKTPAAQAPATPVASLPSPSEPMEERVKGLTRRVLVEDLNDMAEIEAHSLNVQTLKEELRQGRPVDEKMLRLLGLPRDGAGLDQVSVDRLLEALNDLHSHGHRDVRNHYPRGVLEALFKADVQTAEGGGWNVDVRQLAAPGSFSLTWYQKIDADSTMAYAPTLMEFPGFTDRHGGRPVLFLRLAALLGWRYDAAKGLLFMPGPALLTASARGVREGMLGTSLHPVFKYVEGESSDPVYPAQLASWTVPLGVEPEKRATAYQLLHDYFHVFGFTLFPPDMQSSIASDFEVLKSIKTAVEKMPDGREREHLMERHDELRTEIGEFFDNVSAAMVEYIFELREEHQSLPGYVRNKSDFIGQIAALSEQVLGTRPASPAWVQDVDGFLKGHKNKVLEYLSFAPAATVKNPGPPISALARPSSVLSARFRRWLYSLGFIAAAGSASLNADAQTVPAPKGAQTAVPEKEINFSLKPFKLGKNDSVKLIELKIPSAAPAVPAEGAASPALTVHVGRPLLGPADLTAAARARGAKFADLFKTQRRFMVQTPEAERERRVVMEAQTRLLALGADVNWLRNVAAVEIGDVRDAAYGKPLDARERFFLERGFRFREDALVQIRPDGKREIYLKPALADRLLDVLAEYYIQSLPADKAVQARRGWLMLERAFRELVPLPGQGDASWKPAPTARRDLEVLGISPPAIKKILKRLSDAAAPPRATHRGTETFGEKFWSWASMAGAVAAFVLGHPLLGASLFLVPVFLIPAAAGGDGRARGFLGGLTSIFLSGFKEYREIRDHKNTWALRHLSSEETKDLQIPGSPAQKKLEGLRAASARFLAAGDRAATPAGRAFIALTALLAGGALAHWIGDGSWMVDLAAGLSFSALSTSSARRVAQAAAHSSHNIRFYLGLESFRATVGDGRKEEPGAAKADAVRQYLRSLEADPESLQKSLRLIMGSLGSLAILKNPAPIDPRLAGTITSRIDAFIDRRPTRATLRELLRLGGLVGYDDVVEGLVLALGQPSSLDLAKAARNKGRDEEVIIYGQGGPLDIRLLSIDAAERGIRHGLIILNEKDKLQFLKGKDVGDVPSQQGPESIHQQDKGLSIDSVPQIAVESEMTLFKGSADSWVEKYGKEFDALIKECLEWADPSRSAALKPHTRERLPEIREVLERLQKAKDGFVAALQGESSGQEKFEAWRAFQREASGARVLTRDSYLNGGHGLIANEDKWDVPGGHTSSWRVLFSILGTANDFDATKLASLFVPPKPAINLDFSTMGSLPPVQEGITVVSRDGERTLESPFPPGEIWNTMREIGDQVMRGLVDMGNPAVREALVRAVLEAYARSLHHRPVDPGRLATQFVHLMAGLRYLHRWGAQYPLGTLDLSSLYTPEQVRYMAFFKAFAVGLDDPLFVGWFTTSFFDVKNGLAVGMRNQGVLFDVLSASFDAEQITPSVVRFVERRARLAGTESKRELSAGEGAPGEIDAAVPTAVREDFDASLGIVLPQERFGGDGKIDLMDIFREALEERFGGASAVFLSGSPAPDGGLDWDLLKDMNLHFFWDGAEAEDQGAENSVRDSFLQKLAARGIQVERRQSPPFFLDNRGALYRVEIRSSRAAVARLYMETLDAADKLLDGPFPQINLKALKLIYKLAVLRGRGGEFSWLLDEHRKFYAMKNKAKSTEILAVADRAMAVLAVADASDKALNREIAGVIAARDPSGAPTSRAVPSAGSTDEGYVHEAIFKAQQGTQQGAESINQHDESLLIDPAPQTQDLPQELRDYGFSKDFAAPVKYLRLDSHWEIPATHFIAAAFKRELTQGRPVDSRILSGMGLDAGRAAAMPDQAFLEELNALIGDASFVSWLRNSPNPNLTQGELGFWSPAEILRQFYPEGLREDVFPLSLELSGGDRWSLRLTAPVPPGAFQGKERFNDLLAATVYAPYLMATAEAVGDNEPPAAFIRFVGLLGFVYDAETRTLSIPFPAALTESVQALREKMLGASVHPIFAFKKGLSGTVEYNAFLKKGKAPIAANPDKPYELLHDYFHALNFALFPPEIWEPFLTDLNDLAEVRKAMRGLEKGPLKTRLVQEHKDLLKSMNDVVEDFTSGLAAYIFDLEGSRLSPDLLKQFAGFADRISALGREVPGYVGRSSPRGTPVWAQDPDVFLKGYKNRVLEFLKVGSLAENGLKIDGPVTGRAPLLTTLAVQAEGVARGLSRRTVSLWLAPWREKWRVFASMFSEEAERRFLLNHFTEEERRYPAALEASPSYQSLRAGLNRVQQAIVHSIGLGGLLSAGFGGLTFFDPVGGIALWPSIAFTVLGAAAGAFGGNIGFHALHNKQVYEAMESGLLSLVRSAMTYGDMDTLKDLGRLQRAVRDGTLTMADRELLRSEYNIEWNVLTLPGGGSGAAKADAVRQYLRSLEADPESLQKSLRLIMGSLGSLAILKNPAPIDPGLAGTITSRIDAFIDRRPTRATLRELLRLGGLVGYDDVVEGLVRALGQPSALDLAKAARNKGRDEEVIVYGQGGKFDIHLLPLEAAERGILRGLIFVNEDGKLQLSPGKTGASWEALTADIAAAPALSRGGLPASSGGTSVRYEDLEAFVKDFNFKRGTRYEREMDFVRAIRAEAIRLWDARGSDWHADPKMLIVNEVFNKTSALLFWENEAERGKGENPPKATLPIVRAPLTSPQSHPGEKIPAESAGLERTQGEPIFQRRAALSKAMSPEEVLAYFKDNKIAPRQVTQAGLALRPLRPGQKSLHVGTGDSLLPVAEALMGLTVLATDQDPEEIQRMNDLLDRTAGLREEIALRGGSLTYSVEDVLSEGETSSYDHVVAIVHVFEIPLSYMKRFRSLTVSRERLSLEMQDRLQENAIVKLRALCSPGGTLLFGAVPSRVEWALKKGAALGFTDAETVSKDVINAADPVLLLRLPPVFGAEAGGGVAGSSSRANRQGPLTTLAVQAEGAARGFSRRTVSLWLAPRREKWRVFASMFSEEAERRFLLNHFTEEERRYPAALEASPSYQSLRAGLHRVQQAIVHSIGLGGLLSAGFGGLTFFDPVGGIALWPSIAFTVLGAAAGAFGGNIGFHALHNKQVYEAMESGLLSLVRSAMTYGDMDTLKDLMRLQQAVRDGTLTMADREVLRETYNIDWALLTVNRAPSREAVPQADSGRFSEASEIVLLQEIVGGGESFGLARLTRADVEARVGGLSIGDEDRGKARAAMRGKEDAVHALERLRFEAAGRQDAAGAPGAVRVLHFAGLAGERRAQAAAYLLGLLRGRAEGAGLVAVTGIEDFDALAALQPALREHREALLLPPSQEVLSGDTLSVKRLLDHLKRQGVAAPALDVLAASKEAVDASGVSIDVSVRSFTSIAKAVQDWIEKAVFIALQA